MRDDLARRSRVAEEAARAAGEIQKRYHGTSFAFEVKKDPRDVLTQADLESQVVIKEIILNAFPDDIVAGEEDNLPREEISKLLDGNVWTIDPLDATQGFVHDYPIFGPGIAYIEKRQVLVGVMYLPVYDEMISGVCGLGATLNGKPIHVQPPHSLKDSMVGLHIREADDDAIKQFLDTTGRVLKASHGVRILGGPMFGVGYVAAGRMDCFATLSPTRLGVWDLAPGAVIIEEAGGVIATRTGAPFDLMDTGVSCASHQALLDELHAVARGEKV